jgi:hypothetical protein
MPAAKKTTKKRHSVLVADPTNRKAWISAEAYGTTRGKLRKERGKAEDAKCRCGQQASVWSFTPKRGAEIYVAPDRDGKPTGPKFSLDVKRDYTAQCARCRAEDAGHATQSTTS